MKDYLIRTISKEANVRVLACITTNLANEAAQQHQTAPTATAVLAQALTTAALTGALLKVRQRVAIRFEGNGPLKRLIVESDSYGRIRGYVAEPDVDLPRLSDGSFDTATAVGELGLLTVVKDLRLKELAQSTTILEKSDIAQDLTNYFIASEQIPTEIRVGVLLDDDNKVAFAGGILLQTMPPHNETHFQLLVDRLDELPPFEALLSSGKSPESILSMLYDEVEYDFLEKRTLELNCSCSWERTMQALVSLGRAEIQSILDEDGEAIIDCHFCRKQYLYPREVLEEILSHMDE